VIGSLAAGPGRLGLSACPGLPGAPGLEEALAWGPGLVVTLMEGAELEALGRGGIGAALAARGIPWLHRPIPDMGLPPPGFDLAPVLARLGAGGAVLLHCRAGLGRTGMVAGLVLVGLGMAPAAAVRAVRAARPGAIETAAQEALVLAGGRRG